jgi:rifampicin phosphotransferase
MTASVTASGALIEWLGELQGSIDAVGGKAASLDRLARLGFDIPPGFCVTTTAFAAHLAGIREGGPLDEALAALPDEDARALIVDLVGSTVAPIAITRAVAEALERLTDGTAIRLAVRSSAIGEDGKAASYAGLHETELGLAADEVEAAVRRCWSSLWSAAAVAYRRRRSLPDAGAAMAVVVQALVPAVASAVVFTRHPVSGQDDQIVINAIGGLGEPMVSGLATPDTWVIDKASRGVVEFSASGAGERLVATDDGVMRTHDERGEPALGQSELDALVDLAMRVESAFDAPVDIEAAHAGGRWILLQARPITTSGPRG